MQQICDDLEAEHVSLRQLIIDLDQAAWSIPTPSPGWSVRDQISHLWFFDQRASLALADADAFAADAERLMTAGGPEASVLPGREMSGDELLARWDDDRTKLITLARTIDPSSRVPWYGPAMAARSFITARLMETWAHGQDIADAIGVNRVPTARLKHVAHIGVRARPFSYAVNQLKLPSVEVHVRLLGPGDEVWTWNDPGSTDTVCGDALDFSLAVTQRRHLDDTDLQIEGDAAREWMSIAQAFAGGAGSGRSPRDFAD